MLLNNVVNVTTTADCCPLWDGVNNQLTLLTAAISNLLLFSFQSLHSHCSVTTVYCRLPAVNDDF